MYIKTKYKRTFRCLFDWWSVYANLTYSCRICDRCRLVAEPDLTVGLFRAKQRWSLRPYVYLTKPQNDLHVQFVQSHIKINTDRFASLVGDKLNRNKCNVVSYTFPSIQPIGSLYHISEWYTIRHWSKMLHTNTRQWQWKSIFGAFGLARKMRLLYRLTHFETATHICRRFACKRR